MRPIIVASLFLILNFATAAEEPDPLTDPFSGVQFHYGEGGEASWWRGVLKTGNAFGLSAGDDLIFRFGPRLEITHLDLGEKRERERFEELYRITGEMAAIFHQRGTPWVWFANVEAGLFSDLKAIDSDDFDFSARLGGSYQFSETFRLNFGISRQRNFGETQVLPALGFEWKPAPGQALTLVGARLTYSYEISDELILRAGGFPTGGVWNVEESDGTSVDYGMVSYNLGLGVDQKLSDQLWLSVWAGTTLANEVSAEVSGTEVFQEDFDTGWFFSAGVKAYAW